MNIYHQGGLNSLFFSTAALLLQKFAVFVHKFSGEPFLALHQKGLNYRKVLESVFITFDAGHPAGARLTRESILFS